MTRVATFCLAGLVAGLTVTTLSCSRGKPAAQTNGTTAPIQAAQKPAGPAAPATPAPSAVQTPPQMPTSDQLDQIYTKLAAADANVPKEEFDVPALAASLGSDPAKSFAWVRDHTRWVPYSGILRGAGGVILDRRGNSLDRSLLLAELLRANGATVRLAHASLSDSNAQQAWAKLAALPAAAGGSPATASTAHTSNPNAAALDKTIDDLSAQVPTQASMLTGVVKPAASGSTANAAGEALAALRDHYWVQEQQNDAWVDLDPLLPTMQPGQTMQPAEQTLDVDDLPSSLNHRVTMRVVVEQWAQGRLADHELLSYTLPAADALTKRISLFHASPDWPADFTAPGRSQAAKLRTTLVAQTRWVPILQVDDKTLTKKGFSIDGEVWDPSAQNSDAAASPGGLGGGLFGALGGGAPAPAASAAKRPLLADRVATAEWLDYEIDVPGKAPVTVRREIFDLIGPAARQSRSLPKPNVSDDQRAAAGSALIGRIDTLIQGADLSAAYAMHHDIDRELSQKDAWLAVLSEQDRTKQRALAAHLDEDALDGPGALEAYALARQVLSARRADVALGQPNIVTYRTRIKSDGQHLSVEALMDVVAHDRIVRPGVADPFNARLTQGVADTAAEIAGVAGDLSRSRNTVAIFADAAAHGAGVALAAPSQTAGLDALRLSPDVATRAAAGLSDTTVIVLPKSPQTINGEPHVGWWRINRNTGDALGIMDSGFNQGATEDTVITSRASLMLRALNGSFTNATTVAGTNEVELAARLGIQANSAEELGDLFWALARLRTACFDAISAGMGM